MKNIYLLTLAISISACSVAELGVAKQVVKVVCGVSEVLLTNVESEKVKKAFGEDSFGEAVCELFAPIGGLASDTPSKTPTQLSAKLPNGEIVNATVQRIGN